MSGCLPLRSDARRLKKIQFLRQQLRQQMSSIQLFPSGVVDGDAANRRSQVRRKRSNFLIETLMSNSIWREVGNREVAEVLILNAPDIIWEVVATTQANGVNQSLR